MDLDMNIEKLYPHRPFLFANTRVVKSIRNFPIKTLKESYSQDIKPQEKIGEDCVLV